MFFSLPLSLSLSFFLTLRTSTNLTRACNRYILSVRFFVGFSYTKMYANVWRIYFALSIFFLFLRCFRYAGYTQPSLSEIKSRSTHTQHRYTYALDFDNIFCFFFFCISFVWYEGDQTKNNTTQMFGTRSSCVHNHMKLIQFCLFFSRSLPTVLNGRSVDYWNIQMRVKNDGAHICATTQRRWLHIHALHTCVRVCAVCMYAVSHTCIWRAMSERLSIATGVSVCVCSAMYVCSCDLCVREKRECWPSMRNANKIIYFCFHSHVFRYTQFRFHFIFHFPFRAELSWMVSTQQCRNIDSVSQIIQLRKNHMRIWEMCAYYTSCDMCVLLLQWNRTVLIQRLNAKGVKIAIANCLFYSQIILCESCACMTIYYAIIYQSRYALFVGGFNLFLHW